MIETLFEPFDYTLAGEKRPSIAVAVADPIDSVGGSRASNQSASEHTPASATSYPDPWGRPLTNNTRSQDGDLHPTPATTQPRSRTHSPSSSPPPGPAILNQTAHISQRGEGVDYFPVDGTDTPTPSFSRPMNTRPRGSQRSTSMGGGVQVVLNETGSWTDMANQSSALVQNPQAEKPSGMLGFLSRKKGSRQESKGQREGCTWERRRQGHHQQHIISPLHTFSRLPWHGLDGSPRAFTVLPPFFFFSSLSPCSHFLLFHSRRSVPRIVSYYRLLRGVLAFPHLPRTDTCLRRKYDESVSCVLLLIAYTCIYLALGASVRNWALWVDRIVLLADLRTPIWSRVETRR